MSNANSLDQFHKMLPAEAAAILKRLTVVNDEEIEAEMAELAALSPEQIQAELAAAGVDLPAAYQRLRTQLTAVATRPTGLQQLADGIEQVRVGWKNFVALNRNGLELLRRSYTPATTLNGNKRTQLAQALTQASVNVVMVGLSVVEGDVQVALRWMGGTFPAAPPAVSVTIRDVDRPMDYEWPDWNGDIHSTQVLRLRGCGLTKAALQAAGVTLVSYCWEAMANHLYMYLLPSDVRREE